MLSREKILAALSKHRWNVEYFTVEIAVLTKAGLTVDSFLRSELSKETRLRDAAETLLIEHDRSESEAT